jgi:hypothetical protein
MSEKKPRFSFGYVSFMLSIIAFALPMLLLLMFWIIQNSSLSFHITWIYKTVLIVTLFIPWVSVCALGCGIIGLFLKRGRAYALVGMIISLLIIALLFPITS